MERYQQQVAKLIYFKLNNSSDVEDLTQETFVRAYKYLQSYNPEKSMLNWLLAIAMNLCTSWNRKQLVTIPLKNLFHLATEDNVSKKALEQHYFSELKNLIHKLPHKERDVLILHYLHELAISEVGELLKIPTGTVKSRLNRGLTRLRNKTVHLEGREQSETRIL